MLNAKRKQQGIGLVEVLVTIVVLSFGLLALISFQTSILANLSNSSGHYKAVAIAESIAESIQSHYQVHGTFSCESQPSICYVNSGLLNIETEPLISNKMLTVTVKWQEKPFGVGVGTGLVDAEYKMKAKL